MALNFDEDIDNEQEGMIGKILSVARANHEKVNERLDKDFQRFNEKFNERFN